MNYAHLYTGDDGLSYFRDVDEPMSEQGPGTQLSKLFQAKGMIMRRNTADYSSTTTRRRGGSSSST